MFTIDHMKSASTRGVSGNAVAGEGDTTYPVDGADVQRVDAFRGMQCRSPARSVLVGAT